MAPKGQRSVGQILICLAFAGYVAWMIWLLFGQRLGTQIYTQQLAESMNLKPFATIKRYISLLQNSTDPALLRHAIVNLAGNVVMFVPLGFFLPRLFPVFRRFFKTFFVCVMLILSVELTQYAFMLGTCDIDDLILNTVGICIGYLLSRIKQY